MCRFADAGRWVWRRPLVSLPLLTWGLLTPLLYALMPVTAAYRFDLEAANLAEGGIEVNQAEDGTLLWNWSAAAISPDGDKVVVGNGAHKTRIWNVKTGELVPHAPIDVPPELLVQEDDWFPMTIEASKEKKAYVQFVHRHTGKISPRIPLGYTRSERGRLVAYSDENANHLLNLDTQETRHFFVAPTVEQAALVPIEPICFSEDERLLAGVKDEFIVVIDAASGGIVAQLPFRRDDAAHRPHTIVFDPDGQALAWESASGVVVADCADKQRCVIPDAKLIGWQPSGRVLVARRPAESDGLYPRSMKRFESWNWRSECCVAACNMPAHFVAPVVRLWSVPRVPLIVKQTRDGGRVLFAGYVKDPPPGPWMAKARGWVRLPEPHSLFVEFSVLDGETLALEESWRMPAEPNRHGIFQLSANGQYLVYTDGHVVEHWALSPRSWFRSALWAAGGTLTLVLIASLWRFWLDRKRASIAPTAPHPTSTL